MAAAEVAVLVLIIDDEWPATDVTERNVIGSEMMGNEGNPSLARGRCDGCVG